MGDALDEEKERRQQLAGVSWQSAVSSHPSFGLGKHVCLLMSFPSLLLPSVLPIATTPPSFRPWQVRKEARVAIAKERDQQIAVMIAK